jgi:hypothetical protein
MKQLRWLFFGAMILALVVLTQFVARDSASQRRQQVENAIQRALILCYAQEGFYPAKLDYLIEHYGVVVDPNTYFVYYKTFGANIRPDVTVYERNPQ